VLDDEYARALLDKLVEEANELRAVTDSVTLEEAGHVYEVLLAILARQDLNAYDVTRAAASKRQERGGLERRWWWWERSAESRGMGRREGCRSSAA
jgi:predicted house-cleaning noncanonical NTP pyrophosphatase (MazG superfamily)